jgi:hypothetical protein
MMTGAQVVLVHHGCFQLGQHTIWGVVMTCHVWRSAITTSHHSHTRFSSALVRYWLYATVIARQSGLLISNDELRDHIFSLLRPKHFLKWKARHIARYSFGPSPPSSERDAAASSHTGATRAAGSGGKAVEPKRAAVAAGWKGVELPFQLAYPPKFTSCVQRLDNGCWMFPSAKDPGLWLCVQPATTAGHV